MTSAVQVQPAVAFDPKEHVYRLDGRVLPSVTQVLGLAGLIEADWYTEDSRVRGRFIHRAIMYEEREGLDDASIDPRLAGYVMAYRKFVRETGVGPCELLEEPLADPFLSFAGTEDQVRPFRDRPALFEIKSGLQAIWHPLQTAAYHHLVGLYYPHLRGARRFGLYLTKDGRYRLQEHVGRSDFKVFQAALTVAQFREAQR